jgi:hypothetical protein
LPLPILLLDKEEICYIRALWFSNGASLKVFFHKFLHFFLFHLV